MFRSKRDIDNHVHDVLSKTNNEDERVQKCLNFSKLYAGIKDFDSAKRYLESYLHLNQNSAEAHKLLGDILGEIGEEEKSLQSYKKSFSLRKSRDTINRICDLLSKGVGIDDTAESREEWFSLQKSFVNKDMDTHQPTIRQGRNVYHSLVSRNFVSPSGGSPKIGVNGNGNVSNYINSRGVPSPLKGDHAHGFSNNQQFTPKQRGMGSSRLQPSPERMFQEITYLGKKCDDVVEIVAEQNVHTLSEIQILKETLTEEIVSLRDTVEKISLNQNVGDQSSQTLKAIQMLNKTFSQEIGLLRDKVEKVSQQQNQNQSKVVEQPPSQALNGIQKLQEKFSQELGMLRDKVDDISNTQEKILQELYTTSALGFKSLEPVMSEPSSSMLYNIPATTTSFSQAPTLTFPPALSSLSIKEPEIQKPSTVVVAKDPMPSSFPNFSFATVASGVGFADLASKASPSSIGFNKPEAFKGFGGEGMPLFSKIGNSSSPSQFPTFTSSASSAPKVDTTDGDGAAEVVDEFVPTAEFTPVIPLPPLVDVKLGDENENIIFEHRAKVYRFDAELKEWKERGVGNIKILQDKDKPHKVRVLMWREKVLKLACNHWITGDIKVDFYQNNPKVLRWTAVDHAEEEARPEIFSCRFANEDKAAEFKSKLEEMIKIVGSAINITPQVTPQKSTVDKPTKSSDTKPLNELDMFKKQVGSWDCTVCYINNKADKIKCLACETPKPGFEAQVEKEKEEQLKKAVEQIPAFSFGFKAAEPAPSSFTSTATAAENTSNSILPAPAFSFSMPTTTKEVEQPQNPAPSPFVNFSFASAAGGIGFGDLANNTSSPSNFMKPEAFKGFGGEGMPLFSNIGNSSSSPILKSHLANIPNKNDEGGDAAVEVVDEFIPTAEFTPVIPLPPLVEATLGDENENIIFEHRAKVYRFDSELKEWKERGVGNIKILQDKDKSHKIRVLMWREKVLKLACNHWITGDIKVDYYQKNPKVLIWSAIDHAEGEVKPETFTCRFGNEEKAAEFKSKMEEMVEIVVSSPNTSSNVGSTTTTPVKETTPKPVDEKPLNELDLFKKQVGSWDCSICYVNNKADVIKCAACETAKPGFENQVEKGKEEDRKKAAEQIPAFSFGFKSSTTEPAAASSFNSTATADTSNSSATTLPAFSFSLPTNKETEIPNTSANPAPSPFVNFSFSTVAGGLGFGDLAATASPVGFNKSENFKGFGGEGMPLFGNIGAPSSSNQNAGDGDGAAEVVDEFVPTAEFTPVIDLPPLVDVKLGDENENIIFEHRAKVYRFDAELKEWKERGVGNIKILQDKDNPHKVRVLMWREKVLKLACNHWITGDIKVDFYQNNPKALRWTAVDHAEEEARPEIFSCRFANEEKAAEFKSKFEEMIGVVGGAINITPQRPSNNTTTPIVEKSTKSSDAKPLNELDMFKKQVGSWDCTVCYINNKADEIKCLACETPKPGFEAQVEKEKEELVKKASEQAPKFSFGFKSEAVPAANTSAPTFSFSLPATGFQFGESSTISGAKTTTTDLKELQLPEGFFDECKHADCSGCRGCSPEKFDFHSVDSEPLPEAEKEIYETELRYTGNIPEEWVEFDASTQ